jgi:hypothetical protein
MKSGAIHAKGEGEPMSRSLLRVYVMLLCGLIAGCAKAPPPVIEIDGRVTINGKPLPNAEVSFVPLIDFGGEYIATGVTDDDGRYSLTCAGRSGACACENLVMVREGPLPEGLRGYSGEAQAKQARYAAGLKNRPIPPQYGNLAQSTLKLVVKPDRKTYDIELTR